MSKFRKLLTGMSAVALAVALLPVFAAWEAHVINVTAKIENALSVPTEALNFGTVFPQEELAKTLNIQLSQSFQDEPQADDVEYIIRQKPKCAVTADNGETLVGPTWTGHVVVGDNLATQGVVETYWIDCDKDKPKDLQVGPNQTAGLLPSLCEYISKHPDGRDESNNQDGNDGSLNSFHKPWQVVLDDNGTPDNPNDDFYKIVWTDTEGRLARSEQDFEDNWTIDLKVPCFGGFCAQDWANFVLEINDGQTPDLNPDDYTQPIENQHKVFGCNLWVEVTDVSRDITECNDNQDNDGDGLIDELDPQCLNLQGVYDPSINVEFEGQPNPPLP